MALCAMTFVLPATSVVAQTPDIRFASPSGNIDCTINQYIAACRIEEFTPSYTNRPDDCTGAWGSYFYITGNGPAQIGCVTANATTAESTLPYGASIEIAPMTCISQTRGITCTNAQGDGFFLRRSEQRIF